jgi:hypothetical protein
MVRLTLRHGRHPTPTYTFPYQAPQGPVSCAERIFASATDEKFRSAQLSEISGAREGTCK